MSGEEKAVLVTMGRDLDDFCYSALYRQPLPHHSTPHTRDTCESTGPRSSIMRDSRTGVSGSVGVPVGVDEKPLGSRLDLIKMGQYLCVSVMDRELESGICNISGQCSAYSSSNADAGGDDERININIGSLGSKVLLDTSPPSPHPPGSPYAAALSTLRVSAFSKLVRCAAPLCPQVMVFSARGTVCPSLLLFIVPLLPIIRHFTVFVLHTSHYFLLDTYSPSSLPAFSLGSLVSCEIMGIS